MKCEIRATKPEDTGDGELKVSNKVKTEHGNTIKR
jgi:hypothetical protein